jgi:3-oxoacyl-[acyl-carrier protein] reductase
MVHSFADLTGDRNALHVDEEIARRFRSRSPVVHGMLPFSFIVCLEEALPGSSLTYTALDVRFRAPIFVDDHVRLEANVVAVGNGRLEFQARWISETDGDTLIEASGTCRLDGGPPVAVAASTGSRSFLAEELSENTYGIDDLEGRSESLRFSLDPAVLSRFQTLLFAPALGRDDYHFCPNLAASLLLSPLVGMRLPGRYATFSSFKASFDETFALTEHGSVSGTVDQVSQPSESIAVSASFADAGKRIATAKLKILVNPLPRKMIQCETIKERFLDLGIRGKVAVITGSSRGIGETTVKLFAMHGARTIVHYHRGERDAEAVAEEIRTAGGIAVALGCDIRDDSEVRRFFAEVIDVYGRVDILVNNAVKDFRPRSFLKLRWRDYLEELEVSLNGMHNCCREVVPIFKRQGGGKIVSLSSVIVDNPIPGQNKYITAKSAVVGYTRSLARELVTENIQANLVVPNMTETDLLSSIPAEFIKRLGAERVCGRNVAPIEVALAILYLSSPWSDAITGQQIVLNLGEPPFA